MYTWNPDVLKMKMDAGAATWILEHTLKSMKDEIIFGMGRPPIAAYTYSGLDPMSTFPRYKCS